jgi:primosomal protein N'
MRISDISTMGFGTEKIEEEFTALPPQERPHGPGSSGTGMPHRHLGSFAEAKTDILIGTQISPKGPT